MSLEEVQGALEQLRVGTNAAAVELVDRGVDRSRERAPSQIQEVLGSLACLEVQWGVWYRALESAGEKTDRCSCGGRHQLHGTVIDKRWAVVMVARDLLIADGSFEPRTGLAYAEWVFAIRFFLEEQRTGRPKGSPGTSGGGASSAELAIPLSWHRKTHS